MSFRIYYYGGLARVCRTLITTMRCKFTSVPVVDRKNSIYSWDNNVSISPPNLRHVADSTPRLHILEIRDLMHAFVEPSHSLMCSNITAVCLNSASQNLISEKLILAAHVNIFRRVSLQRRVTRRSKIQIYIS